MAIVGRLKLNAQLLCGDEPAIGPGKALVLDAVARAGSISAAGRDLGMSYRRIWLLVDSLNRCWTGPLVETSIGGGATTGARLTDLGRQVLADYRRVETQMVEAARGEAYLRLLAHLRAEPLPARTARPPIDDPRPG